MSNELTADVTNGFILIVEDSPTQAEQLKYILEENQFTVQVASDGRQAMDMIQQETPTLVISDIMMPNMNGYQLCHAIKNQEKWKDIPVILLTSLTNVHDVIKGLQSGADNFITKPYDGKYLITRIQFILANRALRQHTPIGIGIEILLEGQRYRIDAENYQILDLLISSYKAAIEKNQELQRVSEELRVLNNQLEDKVRERTAVLLAEMAERERMANALRESESKYRELVQNTNSVIIRIDTHGCVTFLNEFAESFFGFTQEEILGKSVFESIFPERETTGRDLRETLQDIFHHPHLYKQTILENSRRDGVRAWLFWTVKAIQDAEGRVIEIQGIGSDVSEQKRTEEALRNSELLYQSLVDTLPLCVARKNTDGRYTYVNRCFSLLIGKPPEEMIGKTAFNLFSPEVAEHLHQIDRDVIQSGKKNESNEVMILPNGNKAYIQIFKTPVLNTAGQIIGIQTIFTDVTEKRKLEEQLRLSQKMEAVGHLAGGVAHDFNNLLMVIQWYCDFLLHHTNLPESLHEDVEEIQKAGDRATGLTRQLLAFSRQQVLQPQVMNLNSITKDLTKMLERLIQENIELQTHLDPELNAILADPGQIEQVIVNLVVNAKDALPNGGVIKIETSNVFFSQTYSDHHVDILPGSYVLFSISDTGLGMEEETKMKIFDPFFTTKEIGHGTGLGLSTVYGIVKQSGGYIWVYSEPGQGTIFKIYFPIHSGKVSEITKKEAGKNASGTETILLVEDNAMVRAMAAKILKQNGYTVLEAHDGVEALQISEPYPHPIHLLLSDVIMPRMSGQELSTQLLEIRPGIKILFMSGYTNISSISEGVFENRFGYIQKPFSPDALMRKIRELFERL